MLVLGRKVGEKIVIDNQIVVKVLSIDGNKLRLGIVADKDIPVHRGEVFAAMHGEEALANLEEVKS